MIRAPIPAGEAETNPRPGRARKYRGAVWYLESGDEQLVLREASDVHVCSYPAQNKAGVPIEAHILCADELHSSCRDAQGL